MLIISQRNSWCCVRGLRVIIVRDGRCVGGFVLSSVVSIIAGVWFWYWLCVCRIVALDIDCVRV